MYRGEKPLSLLRGTRGRNDAVSHQQDRISPVYFQQNTVAHLYGSYMYECTKYMRLQIDLDIPNALVRALVPQPLPCTHLATIPCYGKALQAPACQGGACKIQKLDNTL